MSAPSDAWFSVGDKVVWSSQAGGRLKPKTGVVVAVVRAEDDPAKCLPPGTRLKSPGRARDVRSYLVQIGSARDLYWPRTQHLSRG